MIVMHIDANNAYLSWTAVSLLEQGYHQDLRKMPSVIAGNPKDRHGIILAKSIPAKKYGIQTGESLFEARNKCPDLLIFPPNYDLYLMCSEAIFSILNEYSPLIQRYSVDECFIDYTYSEKRFGEPLRTAYAIKERIKKELGFTVNIGIGSNKLLAKMASELEKPDRVHTLFPKEIEEKMWPLPIEELFMVGRATAAKLKKININTIGELAESDLLHMKALLKSHGELVWNYANGNDDSPVIPNTEIQQKGVGNSTTIAYDVTERKEAQEVILALCERLGMRLRKLKRKAALITLSIKTNSFIRYSHQIQLYHYIDVADDIYYYACRLLDECWKGEVIRQIGITASDLGQGEEQQLSLFQNQRCNCEKSRSLESTIDEIRAKYGEKAVIRGTFVNNPVEALQGGVNDGNYLMMGGYQL